MRSSGNQYSAPGGCDVIRCQRLGLGLLPLGLLALLSGIIILAATEQQAVKRWKADRYDPLHHVYMSDCTSDAAQDGKLISFADCPYAIEEGRGKASALVSLFYQILPKDLDKAEDVASVNPLFSPKSHPATLWYTRVTEKKVYARDMTTGMWKYTWVRVGDATNTYMPVHPATMTDTDAVVPVAAVLTDEEKRQCQRDLGEGEGCVNEPASATPPVFLDRKKGVSLRDIVIGSNSSLAARAEARRLGVFQEGLGNPFILTCDDYGQASTPQDTMEKICPLYNLHTPQPPLGTLRFRAPSPANDSSIFYTVCEEAGEGGTCRTGSPYLYVNLGAVRAAGASSAFDVARVVAGKTADYRFSVTYRAHPTTSLISGYAKQERVSREQHLTPWTNPYRGADQAFFIMTSSPGQTSPLPIAHHTDPFDEYATHEDSPTALLWLLRVVGAFVTWVGAHLLLCCVVYLSTVRGTATPCCDLSNNMLMLYGSTVAMSLSLLTIGFNWVTVHTSLAVPLALFVIAGMGVTHHILAKGVGMSGYFPSDLHNQNFSAFVDVEVPALNDTDNVSTTTVESLPPEEKQRLRRPPSPPLPIGEDTLMVEMAAPLANNSFGAPTVAT